jgi:hypothetical protein
MKLLDLEPRYFLRVLSDDKIGRMSGDGAAALFPQLFNLFSVFFPGHGVSFHPIISINSASVGSCDTWRGAGDSMRRMCCAYPGQPSAAFARHESQTR